MRTQIIYHSPADEKSNKNIESLYGLRSWVQVLLRASHVEKEPDELSAFDHAARQHHKQAFPGFKVKKQSGGENSFESYFRPLPADRSGT